MPRSGHDRSRLPCPKCGFVTDVQYKFCASCGAPLAGADAYVESGTDYKPFPEPQRRRLATLSLTLGALAAFPLGLLAGIPAVALGALVLKRRHAGTTPAVAGIILGLAGTLVTTPVLILPRLLGTRPEQQRARVEQTMRVLQQALDSYASANEGWYPPGAPDPADSSGATTPAWLPEELPVNPYTRRPYEYDLDLFYLADALHRPGLAHKDFANDLASPFRSIAAPESMPGTVVVLGCTNHETGLVEEYAIVGFGPDATEPLSDLVEVEGEVRRERVYHVLASPESPDTLAVPAEDSL
jgi:type II secretory pathway pseudopilin PulG